MRPSLETEREMADSAVAVFVYSSVADTHGHPDHVIIIENFSI